MHDRQITDPALRLRMEWANSAAFALRECHPDDAAAICVAYLETVETGGPTLGDPFGMVASDARLWAAAAPPHELTAYTLAGLERLPKSHLSNPARKNCFRAIWHSFTDAERASFIAAASKKGGK
ncbi:MAG: hypothetical protein JJU07_10210 [Natronohydrobacter sp.]|nr:hypothetical protein [Natronohydrobacter sp.]